MNRIAVIAGGVILLLIVGLSWAVNHYRDNAITYKDQRDKATSALTLANNAINDMQVRERDNAALDAKYTGELADERAENEKLRADIAAGKRKLQLNATCSKSNSTGASSLGDGESPRLTTDAELNYWRLRDGISRITKQVNYLQDYIRQQCLR